MENLPIENSYNLFKKLEGGEAYIEAVEQTVPILVDSGEEAALYIPTMEIFVILLFPLLSKEKNL